MLYFMDTIFLVKLTARAWALDILAAFHDGVPGRQAALIGHCGAGRTAFAQSLQHLMELELVERNPGHGHPLRPEFRLTAKGKTAAAMASRIKSATPQDAPAKLLRRAWTVPVLVASQTPQHFSQIKSNLGQITDRALSQSLKTLRAHDWVHRSIDLEFGAPRSVDCASNTGLQIAMAARA